MTYRKFETVLMHIVAAAAILFAIWIAMTLPLLRLRPEAILIPTSARGFPAAFARRKNPHG